MNQPTSSKHSALRETLLNPPPTPTLSPDEEIDAILQQKIAEGLSRWAIRKMGADLGRFMEAAFEEYKFFVFLLSTKGGVKSLTDAMKIARYDPPLNMTGRGSFLAEYNRVREIAKRIKREGKRIRNRA